MFSPPPQKKHWVRCPRKVVHKTSQMKSIVKTLLVAFRRRIKDKSLEKE
jgi:hypothetical protein